MTITTNTRDRLWAVLPKGHALRLQALDILLYAVEHGLTTVEAVENSEDRERLIWGPQPVIPDDLDVTFEEMEARIFHQVGGLEAAWMDDQRRRAVPVVCPSWCEQDHTLRGLDPDGLLLLPFWERVDHGAKLGESDLELVQIQYHPETGQPSRTYVADFSADGEPEEIELEDLLIYVDRKMAGLMAAGNRFIQLRAEGVLR